MHFHRCAQLNYRLFTSGQITRPPHYCIHRIAATAAAACFPVNHCWLRRQIGLIRGPQLKSECERAMQGSQIGCTLSDFAAPPSVTNLTIWEMGRSLSLSLSSLFCKWRSNSIDFQPFSTACWIVEHLIASTSSVSSRVSVCLRLLLHSHSYP